MVLLLLKIQSDTIHKIFIFIIIIIIIKLLPTSFTHLVSGQQNNKDLKKVINGSNVVVQSDGK